jgi:hypothetical protein
VTVGWMKATASRLVPLGVAVPIVLLFAPAASASKPAASAAEAINWLNAQRAANGIPAEITDVPEWNTACSHHVAYLANTRGAESENPHAENPGTRYYTADGAWAAASSVLGASFTAPSPFPSDHLDYDQSYYSYPWGGVNGWEWAPMHLMDLLSPSIARTGYSTGCMVTSDNSRPAPPAPQLLTYPGSGTSFIYPYEFAVEFPFTPGRFVGIPEHTVSGPYIFVLAWGASAGTITQATLTGPSGQVRIATVDDHTPSVGAYMGPGGMLVPYKPLRGGATYTASATFLPDAASQTLTNTWSFKTAWTPNQLTLQVGYAPAHRHVSIVLDTNAPGFVITARRASGGHERVIKGARPSEENANGTISYGSTTFLHLPVGAWRVCARSGGGETGYQSRGLCRGIRVPRR